MQEMWVRSLGQEDPLEKEMSTHSNISAWKIPLTKKPGGIQSMGLQRVRQDLATKQKQVPAPKLGADNRAVNKNRYYPSPPEPYIVLGRQTGDR